MSAWARGYSSLLSSPLGSVGVAGRAGSAEAAASAAAEARVWRRVQEEIFFDGLRGDPSRAARRALRSGQLPEGIRPGVRRRRRHLRQRLPTRQRRRDPGTPVNAWAISATQ